MASSPDMLKIIFISIIIVIVAALGLKFCEASTLTFSDNFESYPDNYSLKNAAAWDNCSLGGGSWTDMRVKEVLGVEGINKEVTGSTSTLPSAQCIYTSTTTTGNVSQCFDFRMAYGAGFWEVADGLGHLLARYFFSDADLDNKFNFEVDNTGFYSYQDTGITIYGGTPTGPSYHICLNFDIINHIQQLCAESNCFATSTLANYQPKNFYLTSYNYGNPTRLLYYNNYTLYSSTTLNFEGTTTSNYSWQWSVPTNEPEISVSGKTMCIIGSTCLLWFGYNYNSIGDDAYLVNDVEGYRTPKFSDYPPRELLANQSRRDYFLLDPESEAKTQNYCIYLDTPTTGKIFCGFEVSWVYENFLGDFSNYNIASACDDVATSSFEWWDPTTYAGAFRYAIECGYRRFTYWAFTPQNSDLISFLSKEQALERSFPINFIKNTEYQTTNLETATATLTSLPVILPGVPLGSLNLLDLNSTSTSRIYPVVSSIREKIVFLLYLFVFFYLVWRILHLARKTKET